MQSVNGWLDSNCEEFEQHVKSLSERVREECVWLQHHPNEQRYDYESHYRQVAKVDKKWKKICHSHFKGALEHELQGSMALVSFILSLSLFFNFVFGA